ncbi:MAG TPA: DsbA family protein, partial [Acidimicrobiales bacterium]
GLQHELEERLFAATFTEGEPIGDREALVKAAVAVGIDESLARDVLDNGAYGQEVRDDEVEAAELGVRGVPFFAFDRRYAVGGAQPPDVLLEVLQQTWAERESAPAQPASG